MAATRYDKGSKIDPELRGTVDFDFFESEDFDQTAKKNGSGDKGQPQDDYYYDDDDSFESDTEDEPVKEPVKSKTRSEEEPKTDKKEPPREERKKSRSPSPKRTESPTPRTSKEKTQKKSENRRRRDSFSSSGSDITEVSPLGSRDASPNHSSRDKKNTDEKRKPRKTKTEMHNEDIDMDILMKTIMKMEKERAREQKKNVMFIPPREPKDQSDKNFSFQKEQLEQIERENHRLLNNILRQHQRKKAGGSTKTQYTLPPCKRQFHSALNRQKEQRRIEQENLKILHRLQNVKASKEVSRNEIMKESRKQAMYGIPVHTGPARRHSDVSNYSTKSYEEDFEDSEWNGETQMNRLQSNSQVSSQPSRKKQPRPSSGHRAKRPEWSERW